MCVRPGLTVDEVRAAEELPRTWGDLDQTSKNAMFATHEAGREELRTICAQDCRL